MTRYSLTLILAMMSGPSAAGWVVVNDHDDYVAYADRSTIARSGDVARMSDLIDLKARRTSPYGVAHSSSRARSEFDCSMPRMRTLSFALHAGQMGAGEVVEEVTPALGWTPVFSGTLLEILRKFACS